MPVTDIAAGDEIVVRMGNVIPFDGVVLSGEEMVNQASLTGDNTSTLVIGLKSMQDLLD